MKTFVIQLEGYDDVISIRDKMAWQSCRRVILVWPKRGKILSSELDLVLLQRAAKANGAELALVTHHPEITEWALEKEIPIFASINAAERSAWKTVPAVVTEKRFKRGGAAIKAKRPAPSNSLLLQKYNIWLRTLAMIASLASLLALFLVIFPAVEITYYPKIYRQTIDIEIMASEGLSSINPSGGIPAFPVFIETSAELSRPSSGITTMTTEKAEGIVSLTNLSEKKLTLPEGTFLVTDDKDPGFFLLMEKVTLPPGIGETQDAKAQALLAGEKGNVDAGRIVSLAGEAGSQVKVTNTAPFSGGKSTQVPTPDEQDYAFLKEELLMNLQDQAEKNLKEDEGQGSQVITGSLQLEEILLEERLGAVGEPFDEATVRMTVRYKALSIKQSDLLAVAEIILNADLQESFSPLNDAIEVIPQGQVSLGQDGSAKWRVTAARLISPKVDFQQAAVYMSGKKIASAKKFFEGLFEQTKPAEFKGPWPWMPFLVTRFRFINGALP